MTSARTLLEPHYRMLHLLAAITAHGYGHLAQTAAVINALRQRMPDLRLTLYTQVSKKLIDTRIEGDYTLINEAPDLGMPMHDALTVNVAAAERAYREYHAAWNEDVAQEARRLNELAPDLILANIPYRILVASRKARIPAVALCSLNWADVYGHFCGANSIHRQMLDAYGAAEVFLRPAPSMPMTELANTRAIGPIGRLGKPRRREIAARCGGKAHDRYVLVSLGGIPMELDVERWPRQEGLHWIVPGDWNIRRPDVTALETLQMNFVDVLASADVLLTKPGYGSFAEAACNGVPVLYVPRSDWPEEPYLVQWLARHGQCLRISQQQLAQGHDLLDALDALSNMPPAPPVPSTGAEEAAACLLAACLNQRPAGGVNP